MNSSNSKRMLRTCKIWISILVQIYVFFYVNKLHYSTSPPNCLHQPLRSFLYVCKKLETQVFPAFIWKWKIFFDNFFENSIYIFRFTLIGTLEIKSLYVPTTTFKWGGRRFLLSLNLKFVLMLIISIIDEKNKFLWK